MRTTFTFDDEMMEGLMRITGRKTPVSAIRQALEEYLQEARKKKVLALRGQVEIENNWRELRGRDTVQ